MSEFQYDVGETKPINLKKRFLITGLISVGLVSLGIWAIYTLLYTSLIQPSIDEIHIEQLKYFEKAREDLAVIQENSFFPEPTSRKASAGKALNNKVYWIEGESSPFRGLPLTLADDLDNNFLSINLTEVENLPSFPGLDQLSQYDHWNLWDSELYKTWASTVKPLVSLPELDYQSIHRQVKITLLRALNKQEVPKVTHQIQKLAQLIATHESTVANLMAVEIYYTTLIALEAAGVPMNKAFEEFRTRVKRFQLYLSGAFHRHAAPEVNQYFKTNAINQVFLCSALAEAYNFYELYYPFDAEAQNLFEQFVSEAENFNCMFVEIVKKTDSEERKKAIISYLAKTSGSDEEDFISLVHLPMANKIVSNLLYSIGSTSSTGLYRRDFPDL